MVCAMPPRNEVQQPLTLGDRFWGKIQQGPVGECWEWKAAKRSGPGSYGAFRLNGQTFQAHRLVYQFHHGSIPPAHIVAHTCDNPPCCNLSHLWVGTQTENMRDMAAKGRTAAQRRTHCPQGHPYDENNTYHYKTRRHCRACKRNDCRLRRLRSHNGAVNA